MMCMKKQKENLQSNSSNFDVVVIGGGAAGLMAGGISSSNGKKTIILEKNERVGKKLLITGKGRCNITNNCDLDTFMKNIPRNASFMYSSFSRFSAHDTIEFFENLGVNVKTERGNRVFPQSDKAAEVTNALRQFALNSGAEIKTCTVTDVVAKDGAITGVQCGDKTICANSVIVTTGGLSYPLTGSTGDGYNFAKKLGHEIIEPTPSLVPIITKQKWCSDVMGLSLKNVTLKVQFNGKQIWEDLGEMLFTHFGVSGPLVLSASSHITHVKGNISDCKLSIDLKPALSAEQLDARILRDFKEKINCDFKNALDNLLPRKIIDTIVRLSGISPDCKVNQISRDERAKLVSVIKGLELSVNKFRPIDEAIITSGGINVKEITPKSMESKLVRGLYFAGEVIDVDGYTGGFNLQIAFSTAVVAGENA